MKSREILPINILCVMLILLASNCSQSSSVIVVEEITFASGEFNITGELKKPSGSGSYPVILFVHGDGPNNRTAGGTYLPIMERMLNAGYATLAWDKPGTGESTGEIDRDKMIVQRAQIVLDALEILKDRADIDQERIGLWGISQAGFVMPMVVSKTDKIAFMIVVSGSGQAGVYQGAYLAASQAACAGFPTDQAKELEKLLAEVELVPNYSAYAALKQQMIEMTAPYPQIDFWFRREVLPENEWHAHDPQHIYVWNPMDVIKNTSIPILAFFGEKDTQVDPFQGEQAYTQALQKAGNNYSRVVFIPGVDHNLVIAETGCLSERDKRSRKDWTNYAPQYLAILEEWLRDLPPPK